MNSAASGKHLPRLDSRHCGSNHSSAVDLKQQNLNSNGENMNQEVIRKNEEKELEFSMIEKVVMQGDLSKLNPEQRVSYYRKVCESSGLNPFTRPFDYITLNGKLTLYAKKDATEQLRKLNGISIEKLESQMMDDIYIVKATARTKDGRVDEATGAVTIGNLKGDAKANAIMKAETKAKRRVTLSISGMGWTDETEIESIPNAKNVNVDLNTGEIREAIIAIPNRLQSMEVVDIKQIKTSKISPDQACELEMILEKCEDKYRNWVYSHIKKQYNTNNLADVPLEIYERMKTAALKNIDEVHAKQNQILPLDPEKVLQEIQ